MTPAVTLIADEHVLAIPIQECGERLVDLRGLDGLAFDDRKRDAAELWLRVREGVARRLLLAQAFGPPLARLLIIEGFRPVEVQERYFEAYSAQLRGEHPDWTTRAIREFASRYVAPPDIRPPHCTGGAVDVTLVDDTGNELDLGTRGQREPGRKRRSLLHRRQWSGRGRGSQSVAARTHDDLGRIRQLRHRMVALVVRRQVLGACDRRSGGPIRLGDAARRRPAQRLKATTRSGGAAAGPDEEDQRKYVLAATVARVEVTVCGLTRTATQKGGSEPQPWPGTDGSATVGDLGVREPPVIVEALCADQEHVWPQREGLAWPFPRAVAPSEPESPLRPRAIIPSRTSPCGTVWKGDRQSPHFARCFYVHLWKIRHNKAFA